jgi:hypothetical protein
MSLKRVILRCLVPDCLSFSLLYCRDLCKKENQNKYEYSTTYIPNIV